MRYSLLFGKTTKSAPSDADSPNARLLEQGGFVEHVMAGVYSWLLTVTGVTPAVIGWGIGFALLMGLVGGVPPAIRAARARIAVTLREL